MFDQLSELSITNNLIPVSEEDNANESTIKSSFISENMTIAHHKSHLNDVKQTKFFPN